LEASGGFSAVLSTAGAAAADLRLDTEIVSLHHEFLTEPSVGRVVIRAQLINLAKNAVLGTRTFEASVRAKSEDPTAGVAAINSALETVVQEIATFAVRSGAAGES
jgi:cholesterol transport system auxiliary component